MELHGNYGVSATSGVADHSLNNGDEPDKRLDGKSSPATEHDACAQKIG